MTVCLIIGDIASDTVVYEDEYPSEVSNRGFIHPNMSKVLGAYNIRQPSSGQIIDAEVR